MLQPKIKLAIIAAALAVISCSFVIIHNCKTTIAFAVFFMGFYFFALISSIIWDMIKTEKQLKKTHEEIEQNLQQMRQFLETEHGRLLDTSNYTTVRVPIITSEGVNRNNDYFGISEINIHDKLVEEKEKQKQKRNVKFDFIANRNNI
jgi:hypothetical protein